MTSKKEVKEKCDNCCKPNSCCDQGHSKSSNGGGAVYGVGIIGAAFYFFPHAAGFTGIVMAVLKSLVWPALLVYHGLRLLGL